MEKNKRMMTIIIAGVLLLTVIGVTVAYFAVSVINGARQNLSATTVESVNLTLDDNDQASYSGQVSFGSTVTRNLKLTNEGGPTKVALYFQDLINTYTAGAFTYTLSYATTERGSYTSVLTDVAIPRRSKASSTAKITEIEMPATTTRYYRIVITYNNLPEVNQTRDLTAQFNTGFIIKKSQDIAYAHANGDYLEDFCVADSNGNCTASSSTVFGNSNYTKSAIYSVQFVNSNAIPDDAIASWDVSQGKNGSVMAWVVGNTYFYYPSSTECQNDLSGGSVLNCETISSTERYVFSYNGTYYYQMTLSTLEECGLRTLGTSYCSKFTATVRGKASTDSSYDLYIGQNGGVIANPNSAHLFDEYSYITSLDLTNLNTEYVIDMSYMFYNAKFLSSLDMRPLNTSNVTKMVGMFSGCEHLTSLNLSDFDISNVTDIALMFSNCKILISLNVSNFDTSNVTNMASMFAGLNSLTTLDLSNFDTASVTRMNEMFSGSGLTSLDVSNFDTSNVTDMNTMFWGVTNLETIDLSNFDTSNVTDTRNMFSYVHGTKVIRLDNANFDNVTSWSQMFYTYDSAVLSAMSVYVNEKGKAFIEQNFPDHLFTIVLV